MRILVCGGRDYADRNRVYDVLDEIHHGTPVTAIIEGGAAGADRFACLWSAKRDIDGHQRFVADWALHGKAAGPLRNARMLAEGKPDLVIAFPGGRGTADLVRKAEAAGVPVRRVSSSTLPASTPEAGR
jgi:hypothetical protein